MKEKTPQTILRNNKKWADEKRAAAPQYFKNLSRGQHPNFLYIGCSDSRVTAEELMGMQPGEVFVHRNVANLVVGTDNNLNAVVQFAVEHLRVKHIIVCGHYECGGVRAAMHPSDLGQLNSWLQTLRDVWRLHYSELNRIKDDARRFDRFAELNVIEQCINLIKVDHIQRSWYRTGRPSIHGWIFDVRSGLLKDLKLNLKKTVGDLRSIYDLKPPGQ
jgi:carbonic anhydrase